jgi:poly-gamma-glutamate capsule biosynthesis protein CapA/YwtB (metallophosphatase superfamily)
MKSNRPVTVAIVGDFWVNRALPRTNSSLEAVLDRLRQAQVSVCVLEMPLSRRGAAAEKIVCMRADPERIEDLKHLGADLVTIANNHMLDYGTDALFDTVELLERFRIPYVGAGRDIAEAARTIVIEREGLRIAFIACAATLPLGSAAGAGRPGVNPLHVFNAWLIEPSARTQEQPGTPPAVITFAAPQDVAALQRAVRDAKRTAEVVVVLPHWGVPNVTQLMEYQRAVAHALAAAGADLIIGYHAHCIQPVEVVGKTPVVYGGGNFLFHELPKGMSRNVYDSMSPDGIIVEAGVGANGVESLELVPIMLDAAGHPGLAARPEAQRIGAHLQSISKPYGCNMTANDDGRCVVSLAGE